MSWLSKNVTDPVSSGFSGLLGFGGKSGPANPFGAPNLAYLNDTSKLDFLKDPTKYKSLLDTSGYDFLKKPAAAVASTSKLDVLPNALKTFGSTYKSPTGNADMSFNDLLGSINAPSSVDNVNSQLDNDRLKQLISGIDTDTRNTVGSLKSDFADRGLGAPGMGSDIEFNSLAQAYGDADKTKAGARMDLAQKELERLKAKETAVQGAYGARYSATAAQDAADKGIAAQGAMTDVNNYDSTLTDSIKAKIAAEDAAAGRTQQNQLTYANLLQGGKQAYAGDVNSNDALFAQLLNARDLGAAGINSSNYNTAQGQQYQYAKPGFLETILNNTKVNIGA